MDIQVTASDVRRAQEVLTLMRAFIQEQASGNELLGRMMGGLHFGQSTVEMEIGGRRQRVSKDVAGAAAKMGGLAEQWQQEFGRDFLPPALDLLAQWLEDFRTRSPVTIALVSARDASIAIASARRPRQIVHLASFCLPSTALI